MTATQMRNDLNTLNNLMSLDNGIAIADKRPKALKLIQKLRANIHNIPREYIRKIRNYCTFFRMAYKRHIGNYKVWLSLEMCYKKQLIFIDHTSTPTGYRLKAKSRTFSGYKKCSSARIDALVAKMELKTAPKFNKVCKSIW